MPRRCLALIVVVSCALSACAKKPVVTAPLVTTPKFPEFIQPVVPQSLAASPAAQNQKTGWALLQSGDLKNAEHEFASALRLVPAFYPAESALGYLELARTDPKAALVRFDRALQAHQSDAATLVGRGQALLALNRDDEALSAFEGAVAADPTLTDLARRVEVMRFRGAERTVDRARQAARAGRTDEAMQLYRT